MNNEFIFERKIREADLDTFGHVNNATYVAIYEEARWEMIEGGGFGLTQIQLQQKGPVILEIAELKFRRELLNRETITVKTCCLEITKNKIMTINQSMHKEDGEVASSMIIKVGLMDMKKRELIRFDDLWLKATGCVVEE